MLSALFPASGELANKFLPQIRAREIFISIVVLLGLSEFACWRGPPPARGPKRKNPVVLAGCVGVGRVNQAWRLESGWWKP
jgi:hypothetical protein